MTGPLKREPIADGVWFSSICDPKFKHNSISVTMLIPLEEGKSSETALVAYLLRMGSRRCPDMTQLERRLSDLYGAVLDADVSRYGEYHMLTFSIAGADDRFALEEGESISRGCAELLGEILLDPNAPDGAFPEETFRLEQQYLIDSIIAEINDKRSYAAQRCTREMGRGYRFAISRYGSVKEAESVTARAVYRRYCEIIRTARIEVFFSGCGSPDYAREIFARLFSAVERTPLVHTPEALPERAEKITCLSEQMSMNQSKLVLGFRTGSFADHRARSAARLMTSLLGGSSASRLFTEVREKLGTCYYCSARINLLTGILLVDCGLDESNREALQQAILAQIADLAAGNITEEELERIKRYFAGALTAMGDSLARMEGWYISQILRGELLTPDEDLAMIRSITCEEVAAAAAALSPDTVFFLQAVKKGGEECDE